MRIRTVVLALLSVSALAGGAWYASLDRETRGLLKALPTNADVLSWEPDQRHAAFRAMDRLPLLAKAAVVTPSPTPMPLPVGEPLVIPGLDQYLQTQGTAGLVIIQDGKVRLERYGQEFDSRGRWTSFSVAKSFTSTLVGAALQDGSIRSLEDKVSEYIPDLRGSAYDDVTIRQLLTMSSGVRWNEDYEDPQADVAKFNNAKPDSGVDATVSYMRKLPRAHPPGEVWHYNTGETNLIGVLVSSATGKPLAQYLQEKIWHPAGMEAQATWLQGKTGHEIAGCCLQAATRDFARFGLFVLANGRANGVQVVPADWFDQATRKQKEIGEPGRGYGFQWWTYDDGAVAAQGIFGQGIFIDPSRRLVIASNSNWSRATLGPEPKAREAFYAQVRALVDVEAESVAEPKSTEAAAAFFNGVKRLCGKTFEGKIVVDQPSPTADDPFVGKRLLMHVRDCGARELRIPFIVGEDRSRTWIVSRTEAGLRLKHDHRHADGTPDDLTMYGGDTLSVGTVRRQSFPSDAETVALFTKHDRVVSVPNIWSLELNDARTLVYELRRPSGRLFRVEFDLTRPVTHAP
ncbi:MAG: beta-lactamase family protein [Gammaproteobacteria bacterium]|nr:beta-lactamase family protein [Gammaproteobacteria bacterium]